MLNYVRHPMSGVLRLESIHLTRFLHFRAVEYRLYCMTYWTPHSNKSCILFPPLKKSMYFFLKKNYFCIKLAFPEKNSEGPLLNPIVSAFSEGYKHLVIP